MLTERRLRLAHRRRRLLGPAGGYTQPAGANVRFQDNWYNQAFAAKPATDLTGNQTLSYFGGGTRCEVDFTFFGGDTSHLDFDISQTGRVEGVDLAGDEIGANDFCIEGFVYFDNILPTDTVNESGMCLMSKYNNTGNQRGWGFMIEEADGAIRFFGSTNGVSVDIDAKTGAISDWQLNTPYYLTVSRQSGVIRIFRDGIEQTLSTNTNPGGTIFDSTAKLKIGMLQSSTGFRRFYVGRTTHTRLTVGEAVAVSNFTVPTVPHPLPV